MNYLNKIKEFNIQHTQIIPSSVSVSNQETVTVLFKGKYHEVSVPLLKFQTLDGRYIYAKPHAFGVPTFSWFFNDSKYKNTEGKENHSWGLFSELCNLIYSPLHQNNVISNAQELCELIINASTETNVSQAWLHMFRGNVAGITRTYNDEIDNEHIYEKISEQGFEKYIQSIYPVWQSNEKSVNFVVQLKGLTRVFLIVKNGFNGDSALSYHIGVYDSEGKIPMHVSKPISRNLHRGLLGNTFNNLVKQLEESRTQEVLMRIEAHFGIQLMMNLHETISDTVEQVKGMQLKRGDIRAPLKRISKSEKSMSKIQDTFSAVMSSIEDGKTGLEIIDDLKLAAKINRCSTAIDILIDYMFSQELVTEEFLKELQGD